MIKSLAHLPKHKREELKHVISVIRELCNDVQMIILFGSFARGDWVEDEYKEGHIVYEYKSDFDILVVTEKKETANDNAIWYRIENKIGYSSNRTDVSIIEHHITDVNYKIDTRHYFFTDIKKEGILLYDSKKFKLARIRKLNVEERKRIAEEDFKIWFKNASTFFRYASLALTNKDYKYSAFNFHQATEHAYTANLLVFSGYKPKIHNISTLGKQVARYEPEFKKIFPRKTKEEDRLFKLLKKAYVDARYKKEYKITKSELEYLSKRVKKLHALTRKACKIKIESFTGSES